MKKLLSFILSLCMVFALCTLPIPAGAQAVEPVEPQAVGEFPVVDAATRALAYQDIDTARAQIRAEIILARNEIIRNESWSDDTYEAVVGNVDTGEILEALPKFSELFPGWENLSETEILAAQQLVANSKSAKRTKTAAEIQEYAHMDIAEAMEAAESEILAARKEVIYSESWVADGYEAYVGDVQTGKVLEVLPTFSELFPGWDLPVEDVGTMSSDEYGIMPLRSEFYPRQVYLSHPAPVITRPFFETTTRGVNEIRSYPTQLPGLNCNIGFTNMGTGVSITQKLRIPLGGFLSVRFGGLTPIGVGVRASTYSTEGNAWITTERFLNN